MDMGGGSRDADADEDAGRYRSELDPEHCV